MVSTRSLLLIAALALTAAAHAQFVETEPNQSKATANAFNVVPGSTITGNSTGTSTTVAGTTSADEFRLNFGAATPAIYRNQLTLATTGTVGHAGSLRGFSQTAGTINTTSDSSFQGTSTATVPARYNQFYTFGTATSLYYRVTGTTSTTADYTATLTQTPVVPTDLGNFAPGTITFATTGLAANGTSRTDTSILVLDGAFNAIANYSNEDVSTADFGSTLARTYTAGTYYFAISNFAVGSNQAAATDDGLKSNPVFDFGGLVANTSPVAGANLSFNVTDANGTQSITGTKAAAYDVNFYRFTVGQPVPEPATIAGLMVGALALLRRRKSA